MTPAGLYIGACKGLVVCKGLVLDCTVMGLSQWLLTDVIS